MVNLLGVWVCWFVFVKVLCFMQVCLLVCWGDGRCGLSYDSLSSGGVGIILLNSGVPLSMAHTLYLCVCIRYGFVDGRSTWINIRKCIDVMIDA